MGAVAQLLAVDLAGPSGAAVDQLVAQGVEAVENHRQQHVRVAAGQRIVRRFFGAGKALLPFGCIDAAALVLPKHLIHVGVVEQNANAPRKLAPDQPVDALVPVQIAELLQKSPECRFVR